MIPPTSAPPTSRGSTSSSANASFAVARDGTRLFVRRRPGASPVTALLSDGIACDGFIWKYLWDDLSSLVNVAHWNYRGHGRSGPPADPKRIELCDHAHDLETVRRSIDDPEVVLIGHSMGCQVSLEAYRIRPEKVRGLVLVCGSSGRITHTFRDNSVLAQILPRMIERMEAHPHVARALWSRIPMALSARLALLTGEVDARAIRVEDLMPYMKHMVDIDLLMYMRMLKSAGEHSAADLLPKIDVPALVIAGERDAFTPPRYAEEMAAALPKSELLMVSGGTHAAPIERRELVRDRIQQFLRDRVGV